MSENTIDRKDLKIQALLEKIATLTQNYENTVADLRVALTVSENTVKDLNESVKELSERVVYLDNQLVPADTSENDETVQEDSAFTE